MTALTVTNATQYDKYFNYRNDGGTPKHILFDGKEVKTFYDISNVTQIIWQSHDSRLRDVNTRLSKSFTVGFTITTSG